MSVCARGAQQAPRLSASLSRAATLISTALVMGDPIRMATMLLGSILASDRLRYIMLLRLDTAENDGFVNLSLAGAAQSAIAAPSHGDCPSVLTVPGWPRPSS